MHNQSMKKRLFYMFLIFSLTSILIVTGAACCLSYQYMMSMATVTSEQMVEKTVTEVDNLLKSMTVMPNLIGRASAVQTAMRTEYLQYRDQFSDRFELDAYLSELNQYNDNIFAMYFFADNGLAAKSRYYAFVSENVADDPYIREVKTSGSTLWLPPSDGSYFAVTTGEKLLTMITPVKELGSGEYRGVVIVEMTVERIQAFLNTRVTESGFLYIQDETGKPIIWPSDMTQQELDQSLNRNNSAANSPWLFQDLHIERVLSSNGWTIVCTIPGEELGANIINIIKLISLISLCVAVLALMAAYHCSAYLVHPILALDEKMQQVEKGNLEVRALVERPDEIGALTEQFNRMIATIRILMKQEVENEKKLRMTELKALQAQIKPHFLYNTLDSIMWLIRADDRDGAIQMIMSLTRFFKIGLSRGSEIIPLREELEHAKSYLVIQSTRYKDQFTYEICVEDGVENCMIPKLVLQPLIENAIYHGMKQKHDRCNLLVWVRSQGQDLLIDVQDNGVGMTPERAEALRNTLYNRHGLHSDSYGVVNVHERINILFGEKYGITFESRLGEGCCFHITLPMQRKEDWQDESIAGR